MTDVLYQIDLAGDVFDSLELDQSPDYVNQLNGDHDHELDSWGIRQGHQQYLEQARFEKEVKSKRVYKPR